MKIEYSDHLENRLVLRRIDRNLPERIFEQAQERYLDTSTGHLIAVMNIDLYNKQRDVMIAYITDEKRTTLLTIHPLKYGQKENRILSGRWRTI
jgi:hypothetical protein